VSFLRTGHIILSSQGFRVLFYLRHAGLAYTKLKIDGQNILNSECFVSHIISNISIKNSSISYDSRVVAGQSCSFILQLKDKSGQEVTEIVQKNMNLEAAAYDFSG